MVRTQQKTFGIGITLVIASIIAIAVFSFHQTQKVDSVTSRIDYTRNVLIQLSDLYSTAIQHASAARNYAFQGKEEEISKIQSTASELLSRLNELKALVRKYPEKRIEIDSLTTSINRRIELSNQFVAAGKEKGQRAAFDLYQTGIGREYNNAIHSVIQKMQADELNTLQLDEQKNAKSITRKNGQLCGWTLPAMPIPRVMNGMIAA